MTELPPATSRRELRERERAALTRQRPSRARATAMPHRTLGARLRSLGVMVFVAALAVGLSIPATGLTSASSAEAAGATGTGTAPTRGGSSSTLGQSAAVAADQTVDVGTRDGYQVQSWAQLLAAHYAQVNNYKFKKGKGSVRWPFPVGAAISSPYGPRVAPCRRCSTFHNGVDFIPGEGTAIFAIADGVATVHDDGTSADGNFVVISHKIGGHKVTSTYAHMLTGSSPIVVGQKIKAGDFIGLVGMSGEATGPHLHFEIAVDGVRTDPIPWMVANVK